MAASLPSTPFPINSFRQRSGDGEPSTELLTFLESLIAEQLAENSTARIPASDKESWASIIEGLSDHFLATFPITDSEDWNVVQGKVKLFSTSLTVIERAALRVDELFVEAGGRFFTVLQRLLGFLFALESCTFPAAALYNSVDSPSTLRRRLVGTIGALLKTFTTNPSESAILKYVMERSLLIMNELLDRIPNAIWPLKLTYLNNSKMSSEKENKLVLELEIDNPAVSCLTLTDILSISIMLFDLTRQDNIHISIWDRELDSVARRILEFVLSSETSLNSQRYEAIASLIWNVQQLHARCDAGRDVLASIPTAVLIFRLRQGPGAEWQPVDNSLHECFKISKISLHPQNSVILVLELALKIDVEEENNLLITSSISAVHLSLKGLESPLLGTLRSLLSTKEAEGPFGILLKALDANSHIEGPLLGKRKRDEEQWKQKAIHIIQSDIFGTDQSWLPSGDPSNAAWISSVLDSIRRKLIQPLEDSSPNSRIRIIEALKGVTCIFAHPDDVECSQSLLQTHPPALSLIPTYIECLTHLQNGLTQEVTPVVSRSVHNALVICMRHHTQGFGDEKLDAVNELVHDGLQSQDRSTRLAAGRGLVEVVRLYQRLGFGRGVNKRLTAIFKTTTTLLSHNKDTVKETTLISLGNVGKTGDPDILGKVLYVLFTQLDRNSILLKGITYMQLLNLAKYHNKTPYLLVSPFMEHISTYIVSVMPQQPNALVETCRFLSLSPTDFLSITLPHTLPQLFGTCNSAALDCLHRELGQSAFNLFLHASADILAHVFLLKKAEETDKALAFILRSFSDAANNATIGLPNLVKTCTIPLLGKLVITMGDENGIVAEDAMRAIRKVERALNSPKNVRHGASQHIGNFLKGYMLGIIALLNDILQDVQGRKTDDMKRKVLFGLNALVREVGPSISAVAPQIMATLQTTVCSTPLSFAALQTWYSFIVTLSLKDLGPHVGPTTAALVNAWPSLRSEERAVAKRTIEFILTDAFKDIGEHANDIADLSTIPELVKSSKKLREIRHGISVKEQILRILDRSYSDNNTVVSQALEELKVFMLQHYGYLVQSLASGDVFDPLVGHLMKALLTVACRDGENIETLRLLAFECMGILGAVDPDRFDILFQDDDMIVLSNYTDENEAMQFAKHLIQATLVGAFRSTSDLKYQSHLAFAIQELLRFCKFTPELAIPGASVPLKVRNRWSSFPKHVLETITPLLEGKFAINNTNIAVNVQHPIYLGQATYREWLQLWTAFLITQTNGQMAKTIFDSFRLVVRNKDVGVAHQILPHLVLNILISGDDNVTQKIRAEIVVVLEDQLNIASTSSPDKRLLSAQAIFMLMDHLNKWIRIMRQRTNLKRNERKRTHHDQGLSQAEMEVTRVDSILASIDQILIAKAAFQCKSYARSLMNFEKQIVSLRSGGTSRDDLQIYYDKLHEIYAHLDEPDGMEGISAFITLPSIEHQIRQHESMGRWTSAQSCWEVRLQQSPDKLEYHLGLLRCLRNLGHYDSLRTHIQGVLVRNPEWVEDLADFRVEGAWMTSDWDTVQRIVNEQQDTWEMAIARLLLALRTSDDAGFVSTLSTTRLQLGVPITAAGEKGYRRAYDAVLKLHLVRDIETIRSSVIRLQEGGQKTQILPDLFSTLSYRLNSTLPTFRTREPVLSVHRTAFSLSQVATTLFKRSIGRAWLDSAKIARKAGHWQTAYSAILQARECNAPLTFFQSAKLVKETGEPLRALYELENALKTTDERRQFLTRGVIDLTEDVQIDELERRRGEAKARLLRARWMQESERFHANAVAKELQNLSVQLAEFESAHFLAGHFQDECYKNLDSVEKATSQGLRMNVYTVRYYAAAIQLGSKYAYQTIPRLLTIWLDMGEDKAHASSDYFIKINDEIQRAIARTPVYKWMTAFPQIVSRVDHRSNKVFTTLSLLISTVLQEYPQQGLWLFVSAVKSTKKKREERGKAILEQLKNNPKNANNGVPNLIRHAMDMATELLRLCDYEIRNDNVKTLSVSKNLPALGRLTPSPLIIPLQESMTVSLPATSSSGSTHQPFPPDAPTISAFFDEIDIMKSLAKPRKITLEGSDGNVYMFLGKPKDDLRKDARLMDFNSIINKLLRTNSESRRRQLRIRTYSVVTLNEECGFIQWVPNTTPIRPVLLKYYATRGVEPWSAEMGGIFKKIKEATDREAVKIFQERILKQFPPIFHEWFLDTFPEPTAWLSSRHAYGRTLAVMSMVGFILGLGDRHLENILLDVNSGDAVHVDFNCLFEKGALLETPERVPFRLTQNLVDALGVTGVEGPFRNASEIALQLLRDNKDILMSVLDAFIHDPLVEWELDSRKQEKRARIKGDNNGVKESADLRVLAKNALIPIEKKLRGVYTRDSNKKEKEISTSNLVQVLIEEATDKHNLAKMYPGWTPWH